MTAQILAEPSSTLFANAADGWHRRDRLYTGAAIFVALLAVPMLAAAAFDARQIADVGIWVKPLKFVLALTIYLATLAWYGGFLPAAARQSRFYRLHAIAVVAAIAAELAVIAGAAAMGTISHFNQSSPAWQVIYPLMGVGAVLLTSATAVQGWFMRTAELKPVLRSGLVWGLLLTLPLTLITAGTMSQMGGHLVGGNPSDAEAVALMGWARDGGDLRVAHFFASHAMHVIPGLAVVSAVLFGASDRRPLMVATALYIVLVAFTFIQALSGQPFLAGLL